MLPTIAGVTNAQGRVRLPAMERKGFGKVAVVTEAFGRQLLRLTDKADEPAERTIRLRPVGRVEGRIFASRPELARGVELYFSTEEESGNQGTGWPRARPTSSPTTKAGSRSRRWPRAR